MCIETAGNVPDWLTFLYACAKIGAVAVTVNTNYKQAELEYLCQNSDMHTPVSYTHLNPYDPIFILLIKRRSLVHQHRSLRKIQ